jgi:integrase
MLSNSIIHDALVKSLSCDQGKPHLEVYDSELRGFYVDVLASGRKSYRLRYRFEKKLRITTLGDARYMNAQEARELAHAILRQAKQGKDPLAVASSALGPTVQEFFLEKYMPYVKSYKRSWQTDLSMINNHIVKRCGKLRMGSATPADIAIFLDGMKQSGFAAGTINRALVLMRYGFELAIRWGEPGVLKNPLKEIKNLRDDNRIERYLTIEQTGLLASAVEQSENKMLRFIVLFLIFTGARKREALDARWQDIDWDKRSWRIPKTKSGKIRHVPLSSGAMELLETLKGMALKRESSGATAAPGQAKGFHLLAGRAIFVNEKTNKPFVSFFYSWNTARIAVGLPQLRVHDLRHSFASFLVNAGRSLNEVQELLGHADIRTTSRYAHLSRERLIAAVEFVPQITIAK